MNGGKKKDHDYRDALVRRELNRDLGLLNAAQPMLPYATPGIASLLAGQAGRLASLDTDNVFFRQQQLRARVEQDMAVQQTMAILKQQQQLQQQTAQQRLAQLTNEQLMYQGLGLGVPGHWMGSSPLSTLSMLGQSTRTDNFGPVGADSMMALLQEEQLRRGDQQNLLEQIMLLEQSQRLQGLRQQQQQEEKDQGRTGRPDPNNFFNSNL
jgi:hypothetical protein